MTLPDPVLFDLPTSLQTEHLLLRVPQPGDGAVVHEAVAQALPELREFLSAVPWVAAEPSVEQSEIFCRNAQANFLARRDMPFLLFERTRGRYVGTVGLHRPDWSIPKVEVGYWRRPDVAGKGWVSEAVTAVVGYAFAQLGAARIELITDARNLASRRVAERCGFTLEGLLRNQRRAADGSLRDTCLYARVPGPGEVDLPARLRAAMPKLASLDTGRSVAFFERLGFQRRYLDADYAIVSRDGVQLHFWRCDDARIPRETGCRVAVEGIEALYADFSAQQVIHPNGPLALKPWGIHEFSILDPDGNLLTFQQDPPPQPAAAR